MIEERDPVSIGDRSHHNVRAGSLIVPDYRGSSVGFHLIASEVEPDGYVRRLYATSRPTRLEHDELVYNVFWTVPSDRVVW